MNIPIAITKAKPQEAPELAHMAREIFIETFAPHNTAANLNHYLHTDMSDEVFESQISDPAYMTFMVRQEKTMVGYIQLYANPNETHGSASLELKRFYLRSKWHGQGVAHQMMSFVFQEMKALEESQIWLGVWEHNVKARKFYYKFGFKDVADHPFMMGTDVQRDLILLKDLKEKNPAH